MRSLAVESLSVRTFRNLTSVDVALGPRFNVVSGDNGQGKTNLLEAIYVLATSRSFRTSKVGELLHQGDEVASIRARIREDGDVRDQSLGLSRGVRTARIDEKRPPTLAAYAVRTPIVVFHAAAMGLTTAGGAERRKLLDRLALYLWPSSLADSLGYAKAARARQRVLEERGDRAADLESWEELMVRHGLALSKARGMAAERLAPAAIGAFARIGPSDLRLGVRYERSAPEEAEAFRGTLASSRARDRARGSARVGPHRDELQLQLGGRPLRGIASQGQHRAVVLALELAEMEVVGQTCGLRPILLLDDVSSELDRVRSAALFEVLRGEQGQVVITTARPELLAVADSPRMEDRRDFTVVSGRVAAH